MARERLPSDRVTGALVRLYEQAEANLRISVERAIESGALGTASYRNRQIAAIHGYLSKLQDTAVPLATDAVGQAYRDQALRVDEMMGVSGGFAGHHDAAAKVFADQLSGSLNEAAEKVGRQVEDVFRSVGVKQTALGVLEGAARADVSKAIVDDLIHEGVTGFVDNGGRRWTLQSYASMVARTTTREAATAGTVNRMEDVGLKLVTISDHGTTTEICQEWEGGTFAIPGETVEGYDTIPELPPFHPNCQHVTTPAAENLDLLEGKPPPTSTPPPEPTPAAPEPAAPEPTPEPPTPDVPADLPTASSMIGNDIPGAEGALVDDSLAAIDKVHRMPGNLDIEPPRVSYPERAFKRGVFGQYAQRISGLSGEVIEIAISLSKRSLKGVKLEGADAGKAGDVVVDSTVHETGHFLDSVHLGARPRPRATPVGRGYKAQYGSDFTNEETQAWRDAVRSTQVGQDVKTFGSKYAAGDDELWARCYEQWIAERADHSPLKEKIAKWVAAEEREGQRWRSFWTPEEFVPIGEAMDDLFARAGLR